MIGGYCQKHQRCRLHGEGLALGKSFCRNFFRGCDSEVAEGVKTCAGCLAKNKEGKTACAHEGCNFQAKADDAYCGKHQRDKIREEAKTKGIRYCDIARGCMKILDKDAVKCEACLEVARRNEKVRFDERVLASEVLRNTLSISARCCVMCGKDFECFMTKYHKESVKCRHCQETMQKQDDKRPDRGRIYKKEMFQYLETYYQQYTNVAKRRDISFELTLEQFGDMVKKPCHYCNYIKEGEANGIDRVDNDKGYHLDNCVACCGICNRMKHAYHLDFFLQKVMQIATNTPPSADFVTTWQRHYPRKATSFKQYISMSAKRKVPLNLIETQYNEITHKPCYLCGYSNTEGIGIDRMDNSIREYTYENCRPCCHSCNIMKATVSYQEFIDKCKEISTKVKIDSES